MKKTDYSGPWNDFCKKDSKITTRLTDLLNLGTKNEINKLLPQILEDREKIQTEFIDKILYEIPSKDVIWYLDRVTHLNNFLKQDIQRKTPISRLDITPPWAIAIKKLYEKIKE